VPNARYVARRGRPRPSLIVGRAERSPTRDDLLRFLAVLLDRRVSNLDERHERIARR
jgi:hypothetical protein